LWTAVGTGILVSSITNSTLLADAREKFAYIPDGDMKAFTDKLAENINKACI